jgi:hypothetical protein
MGELMKYSEAPHTEGNDLRAVVEALDSLRDEIGQRHTENTDTLEVVEKKLEVVIERVDDLAKGFPEGDAEGHRRYHEALIEKAKARTRLYEQLLEKLMEKGIWALLLLLAFSLWQYIKAQVKG